jgi:uncharacterized protein
MITLPRVLTTTVERLLQTMPAVVVMGARQTGKSTLARELLSGTRSYFSLDDLDVRAQAERAPQDLVRRADRLVLDEVQRAPEVLLAVKRAVDEERRPGQFLLTGSANLLLMQRVSESLAGRAAYATLWPLTQAELRGAGSAGRWSELFSAQERDWPELLASMAPRPNDWREAVRRGGYPVPAVTGRNAEDRAIWLDGYVRTYLERDLQDLSAIDNLIDYRRLMSACCLRIGQLLNQTELGRDVQLPQPTVRRWLNLLEASFQLIRVPAFARNRTKRLIKTPKAYWCDTGLALHLSGADNPPGPLFENLVLSDLVAWRDGALVDRPDVFYWRTATGEEVDFVVEWRGELIAVEVKATMRPRVTDAAHLRSFREEYGASVNGCLLLHGGDALERLAPGIVAAPWWRVL